MNTVFSFRMSELDERENSELKETTAATDGETESAAATAEALESDIEVDGEDNTDREEKAKEDNLLPVEGGRSVLEEVWLRPDLNEPPSPVDMMRRTPPPPPPPPPHSSGTKLNAPSARSRPRTDQGYVCSAPSKYWVTVVICNKHLLTF